MENKDFKWCILVTEDNINALNQYLKDNKEKYNKYTNKWKVSVEKGETIFFKNQSVDDCHSKLTVPKDFTLITTEQFKKKYPQYFESKLSDFDSTKWYKWIYSIGDKGMCLVYFKPSFYNLNTNGNNLTISEAIYSNKKYEIKNINVSADLIKASKQLTDLSEIQEFLPDNHPDKEVKSVNMQAILEECKIIFPLESKFKNSAVAADKDSEYIVKGYKIFKDKRGDVIENYSGSGLLYLNGKYAELISLPEKKYDYEVVHCTTQEEWDFIISKCDKKSRIIKESSCFQKYYKEYPEGIAVSIKDNSYCGLDYFKKENAKIYSFEEWCNKNNINMESKEEYKKGDYIVCLPKGNPAPKIFAHQESGSGFKANFCFKIQSINKHDQQSAIFVDLGNGIWSNSVRKATVNEITEYNRLQKPYDTTSLKRKYHISEFTPESNLVPIFIKKVCTSQTKKEVKEIKILTNNLIKF